MVAAPLTTIKNQARDKKQTSKGFKPSTTARKESTKKQTAMVKLSDIIVPFWYPKIFVSQGEVDNAVEQIKNDILGYEEITVKYLPGSKEYELIKGLVSLKAHKQMRSERIKAEVIDDSTVSKADSMLAAISYNSHSGLNHYESVIAVVRYIETELELKEIVTWTTDETTGVRQSRITNSQDRAIGKLNCMLNYKRESKKDKPSKDRLENLRKVLSENDELVINRILGAINLDLGTFVKKRLPLLGLQPEIAGALKRGELAYSKAISLSRLGMTKEIQQLIDGYGDIQVRSALDKERLNLLDRTLKERLNTNELSQLIGDANTRLLAIGTNTDDKSLSETESGERKVRKADMEMNSEIRNYLFEAKKYFRDWDFLSQLDDRDKSKIKNKAESLIDMIESYNEKLTEQAAKKSKEAKEKAEIASRNPTSNRQLEKAKLGIL